MLAHLGPMLGLCWPTWGLCWGHVRPSWGYVDPRRWFWGYVVFMTSLHSQNFAWKSFPHWPARHPLHFCNTVSLKQLNPAWDGHSPDSAWRLPQLACEVPGNASRGSEEGSAAFVGFPLAKLRLASATAQPDSKGSQERAGPAGRGEDIDLEWLRSRIRSESKWSCKSL